MPQGKTSAAINTWTTELTKRPTAGATPPTQLFATWDADHHAKVRQADIRAKAAVPKLVPDLSEGVATGEFDNLL